MSESELRDMLNNLRYDWNNPKFWFNAKYINEVHDSGAAAGPETQDYTVPNGAIWIIDYAYGSVSGQQTYCTGFIIPEGQVAGTANRIGTEQATRSGDAASFLSGIQLPLVLGPNETLRCTTVRPAGGALHYFNIRYQEILI